ncbi:hypothetical protein BP5796_11725 [Coleophoma crateriformis]|uniref:Cylicin I n=1 Tax=Coleophoma crateriformis TaxID=565419 RepID=A0A3D8QE70_9HELO|nr:hypothetical protein BP5796_11725 [Coleophoma crateriformis]
MAASAPKSYSLDPSLYIYTSLTAGSSHIVTATSRLETILKANRIPFKAIDVATDEKARMLWGRRAGKDESGRARKLPGLVQEGLVVGDLVEIEEWNEYRELKQHVKIVSEGATWTPPPLANTMPKKKAPAKKATAKKENEVPAASEPSKTTAVKEEETKSPAAGEPNTISLAIRQVGQEAAQKAKDVKKKAAETISGAQKAEPVAEKKEAEKKEEAPKKEAETNTPAPISVDLPKKASGIEDATLMQSPTSTAWKRAPDGHIAAMLAYDNSDSAARPTTMHRGSEVSQASAEEIKQIEEECKIVEEDEDAVES